MYKKYSSAKFTGSNSEGQLPFSRSKRCVVEHYEYNNSYSEFKKMAQIEEQAELYPHSEFKTGSNSSRVPSESPFNFKKFKSNFKFKHDKRSSRCSNLTISNSNHTISSNQSSSVLSDITNKHNFSQRFKTNLSKFSSPFDPTSQLPKSKHSFSIHKGINLDCSETVVISSNTPTNDEFKSKLWSNSGRVPDEMKFKTELWKNFIEGRKCPFKARCRFAHGKHELNLKYIKNERFKSKICGPYHNGMYCSYGSRCLFKHFDYSADFQWSYYSNSVSYHLL